MRPPRSRAVRGQGDVYTGLHTRLLGGPSLGERRWVLSSLRKGNRRRLRSDWCEPSTSERLTRETVIA